MDILVPSLDALRRTCGGTLTLREVCMIVDQMIYRLEFLHSRGIVSCDVKPQNFTGIADKDSDTVNLMDFGDHAAASTSCRSSAMAGETGLMPGRNFGRIEIQGIEYEGDTFKRLPGYDTRCFKMRSRCDVCESASEITADRKL
ncbi:hypothetical protein C8Q70DRAFT_92998 [Cubamyces menziesii]|nr:hypothetical protein C8Q70DRAFT_92998 [Cubamyces menziesii]